MEGLVGWGKQSELFIGVLWLVEHWLGLAGWFGYCTVPGTYMKTCGLQYRKRFQLSVFGLFSGRTSKYFSQLGLSTLPPDSMRNIDLILQGPLQDHLGVSTSMLRIG